MPSYLLTQETCNTPVFCTHLNCLDILVAICQVYFNPLNAELNPICHLLVLLGAHPILHISRIRVNLVLFLKACDHCFTEQMYVGDV
jgi:hypothetical protein